LVSEIPSTKEDLILPVNLNKLFTDIHPALRRRDYCQRSINNKMAAVKATTANPTQSHAHLKRLVRLTDQKKGDDDDDDK